MADKINNAREITATTGTGTITLGGAPDGWLTFEDAGAESGRPYVVKIEEGNDFELVRGVWTDEGGGVHIFTRDEVIQSLDDGVAGTSKLDLAGNATVTVVAVAEHFVASEIANDSEADGDTVAEALDGIDASARNALSLLAHTPRFSLRQAIDALGLSADLKLCLDAGAADSYPGSGQTWVDVSGNGHDFLLGATSGAESSDPTFNGKAGGLSGSEYWSFDGGDFFTIDEANPAWLNNFHKDGAALTIFAIIRPTGSNSNGIIGTSASNTNNIGFAFFINTNTGVMTFSVQNGSGTVSKVISNNFGITDGVTYIICVSVDEAGDVSRLYCNGVTVDGTGAYSAPSASDATLTAVIGRVGGASAPIRDGGTLRNVAAWSRAMSRSEIVSLGDALQKLLTVTGDRLIGLASQVTNDSDVDGDTVAEALDALAPITSGVTITVGPTGDYATIGAALEEAARLRPTFVDGGIGVTIELEAAFEMAEQVFIVDQDLGFVTIVSDQPEHVFTATRTNGSANLTSVSSTTGLAVGDLLIGVGGNCRGAIITDISGSTVTMDRAATSTASGVSITAKAPVPLVRSALSVATPGETGEGSPEYAAFVGLRSKMPTIGCLFDMDDSGGSGSGDYRALVHCLEMSSIKVLPEAGCVNAASRGILVRRASQAILDGSLWDHCQGLPAEQSSPDGGPMTFRDSSIGTARAASCRFAERSSGLYVNQGSSVSAAGINCSDAARRGIYANAAANVRAEEAICRNCGLSGIRAASASTIDAQDADCRDSSQVGVSAVQASLVQAQDANVSGAGTNGFSLGGGSIINLATGATGTRSQAAAVTSDGIMNGGGNASAMHIGARQGTFEVSSGGAIAPTGPGHWRIDSNGASGNDDLDSITGYNGITGGDIAILSTVSSSRDITVRQVGNIRLATSTVVLGAAQDRLTLHYDSPTGNWFEVARAIS